MKFPFAKKKKNAKTKMNASTAAAGRRAPQAVEYEEPNVSLSSAVVVVLILHLVLVGAIVSFNYIKSHRAAAAVDEPAQHTQADTAASNGDTDAVPATNNNVTPVRQDTAVPDRPAPTPAAVASSSTVKSSGNFYTVAKGDTPVGIARKLHVNYDDLLKLNKIEDPKKLRIGEKLKVPMKRTNSQTAQTTQTT